MLEFGGPKRRDLRKGIWLAASIVAGVVGLYSEGWKKEMIGGSTCG